MNADELREILKSHELWVSSEGRDGARANLTDANLYRADLTRANLSDANLTGASLTRADLTGANLWGAILPVDVTPQVGSPRKISTGRWR